MKIVKVLAVMILAMPLWLPAQTVVITSPNGGENWKLGANQNVVWTFTGIPNGTPVKLVLFRNNDKIGQIVENISIGAGGGGMFSWKVGNWQGGTAAAGGGYKVRIRDMNGQYPPDDSNNPFTITPGGITAGLSQDVALKQNPGFKPQVAQGATFGEFCPNCDKYEEHPQITNWLNPKVSSDWIFNNVNSTRPKGYPQGADPNAYAHVGYDYFTLAGTYGPVWTTFCYRSWVWVNMVRFQDYIAAGRKLVSAKLHLKQVSSYIAGDNHASCAVGLSVFLAPWTDFWNFQVTHEGMETGGLDFGSTDYSKDITGVVKKWLDGTFPNCGLLLTSEEVNWGHQAKTCYSAFDVTMTLWFTKN